MRFWSACLVLSLAPLLGAAPSNACIALGRTYSLEGAFPAPDASDVPLDAPLVLRAADIPPGATWDGTLFATVSPLSEAESHLPVSQVQHGLGARESEVFVFVPLEALKANTRYAVDLVAPPAAAPGEGTPQVTWEFTTGSAVQPPLRLKGALTVEFEADVDPVFTCPDMASLCGGACPQTGETPVTKAHVWLPAAFDGFSRQGVAGELHVTKQDPDGTPGDVMLFSEPKVVPGEVSETRVTMPLDHGASYAPCFELTLQDVRGERATTSVCLDAPFPLPSGLVDVNGAGGDAMGGDATGGAATGGATTGGATTGGGTTGGGTTAGQSAPAEPAPPAKHTSSACAFAPSGGGAGTLLLGAAVLGALAFARSRRRTRTRARA